MKKLAMVTLLFSAFLVGCDTKEKSTNDQTDKVVITNYENKKGATEFEAVDREYSSVPQKVFVNTKPAAELLLHLGLAENIEGVGADFGSGDKSVATEYAKLKKVSTEYVGKELALSIDPDMMYGRSSLFSEEEWGNGSVESLNEMNMPTFTLGSSVEGGTFESVYTDIERTGQLFHVEEKAADFTKELKSREAAVKKKIGNKPAATFAYLHMSTPKDIMVYSANKETFFNSVFDMLNLTNVFKDVAGEVSLETLIETNPDYLIVPDWTDDKGNGVSSDEIIQALLKDPRVKEMQAVKNKKIYGLDYNVMFGYGYQSLDGIESLAEQIYGEK